MSILETMPFMYAFLLLVHQCENSLIVKTFLPLIKMVTDFNSCENKKTEIVAVALSDGQRSKKDEDTYSMTQMGFVVILCGIIPNFQRKIYDYQRSFYITI